MHDHETPSATPFGIVRQSYAGAIRQRLARIERKVHSGMRHEAIRRELEAEEGISASIGTFRKSLSRARIWWRRQIIQQQLPQTLQASSEQMVDLGRAAPSLRPRVPITPAPHAPRSHDVMPKTHPQAPDLDQFFQRKSVFKKREH
jgi:hypothetical protein